MRRHPAFPSRPLRLGLGWLLAACALTACAQATGPAPSPAPAEDIGTLYRLIRDEIGDPTCRDTSECRSSPVGQKACGGPAGYLVWSTTVSDAARLLPLLERYRRASEAENQRAGMVSDCRMVSDPGARCEAGRCVAGPRGPAVM